MIRYKIVVNGLVQGVGFRQFTLRKAGFYGIYGWVRNLENGTVEIEAEGLQENMEHFLSGNRGKIETACIMATKCLKIGNKN
ncbi:acylphosphatase [Neobacillus sp. 114]|uniref:acylphosphatase n=1 Tax=Neobacillus sp. 114 TaxID=3048535 RepID=UPI0024C45E9A|nr:acylphosphatase [Neobacillus sp. 114]